MLSQIFPGSEVYLSRKKRRKRRKKVVTRAQFHSLCSGDRSKERNLRFTQEAAYEQALQEISWLGGGTA